MIRLENVETYGWEAAVRGMRNPLNSWDKSDSFKTEKLEIADFETGEPVVVYEKGGIGPNDLDLMKRLVKAGTDHSKFMRMIGVSLDIVAPLYWWKEFDTYKIGTVANSCSTMHKIHAKEFTLDDFSHEHLTFYEHEGELCRDFLGTLEDLVDELNVARKLFIETKDKKYWWQMIQLLPTSYNQRRTVTLNYAVLANIYKARKNHKLDEWRDFCRWIESLPYSELMVGVENE